MSGPAFAIVMLFTVVWSPTGTPQPSVQVVADMAKCRTELQTFSTAMEIDNAGEPPAFQQDYAGECVRYTPQEGPDIRGPI